VRSSEPWNSDEQRLDVRGKAVSFAFLRANLEKGDPAGGEKVGSNLP
jgi:hypothetical protein